MGERKVPPCKYMKTRYNFSSFVVFHNMLLCHKLYNHYSISGYLDCCLVLAILNNVVLNILVYVSLQT